MTQIIGLIVLLCLSPKVLDENAQWPAFRGQGNSLTSATDLPVSWSDQDNILWKASILGYGQSSPVIWNDRVFVTSMQGEMKQTPTVLCFGLDDGRMIWKKEFTSSQKVEVSGYVSRGAPTPAVDGNLVYAFFESGDLIATDHHGDVKWQRSLVDEYGEFKGNHGIGSSLAIDDQSIYLLAAHEGPCYLLAIDKRSGKNRWKSELATQVAWSSPVASGDQVMIGLPGNIQAFDSRTGQSLWKMSDITGNTVASLTINDEIGFVGSSERGQCMAISFRHVDTAGGPEVLWRSDELSNSFGSPLWFDDRVYFVDKSGIAYCVMAESGTAIWKHRLGDSCWASPIAGSGRIYFFTKGGTTVVMRPDDQSNVLSTNPLTIDGRVYGVAATHGKFVIRTGSNLICVGESN